METLIKNIFRKKTSDDLVREIHNEFDTAGDNLLKQAQAILEKIAKENIDETLEKKAKFMEDIGFTNSKLVIDINNKKMNIKKIKDNAESDAQIVMYYKDKYPNLKFLKESDLDIICKKYNLVYAPIQNYIENVPDKNLNDIAKAQVLDKKDEIIAKYFYNKISIAGNKDTLLAKLKKDVLKYISKLSLEVDRSQYEETYSWERYKYISDHLNEKYETNIFDNIIFNLERTRIALGGLFICAPEKHFNLKGLSKDNKYGFFEKVTHKINAPKDPIVFRYVKGGIQVITKWGIEAEDRLLAD